MQFPKDKIYLAPIKWISLVEARELYPPKEEFVEFPKDKTYRSEEYKAYIRELPCIVCGGNAEPHHEVSGGMAIKGPDLFCLPFCREHHRIRHDKGQIMFWKDLGYDRWAVIAGTLAKVWEIKENEHHTST